MFIIYIIKSDGTQSRQIVNRIFIDGITRFGEIDCWSSDGEWIIYHQCDTYPCFVDESTIYKVNIINGYEEKIFSGGAYPDWRP